MRLFLIGLIVPLGVAACGYVSEYEKHVHDWQPVYCYQSLGNVQCFDEPRHRDKLRLVNYYGPHPSRYDAPDAPDRAMPPAPNPIGHWVKDPEPIPEELLERASRSPVREAAEQVPERAENMRSGTL